MGMRIQGICAVGFFLFVYKARNLMCIYLCFDIRNEDDTFYSFGFYCIQFYRFTCKSATTICIGYFCNTIVLIVVAVSLIACDVDEILPSHFVLIIPNLSLLEFDSILLIVFSRKRNILLYSIVKSSHSVCQIFFSTFLLRYRSVFWQILYFISQKKYRDLTI